MACKALRVQIPLPPPKRLLLQPARRHSALNYLTPNEFEELQLPKLRPHSQESDAFNGYTPVGTGDGDRTRVLRLGNWCACLGFSQSDYIDSIHEPHILQYLILCAGQKSTFKTLDNCPSLRLSFPRCPVASPNVSLVRAGNVFRSGWQRFLHRRKQSWSLQTPSISNSA
jgi:hypothetical protein